MKLVISGVLLLSGFVSKGQQHDYVPFFHKMRSAYELYGQQHYCETAEFLGTIYSDTTISFPDGYLLLAKSKYLSGEKEESFKWFRLSIEKQGCDLKRYSTLESDSAYAEQLAEDSSWQELMTDYPRLHQNHEQTLNVSLRESIDSLTQEDQRIRKKRKEFDNQEDFRRSVARVDSTNFVALKELIRNNGGMPDRFKIGNNYFRFLTMLFHYIHPDNKQEWEYYTDMLFRNFKEEGGFPDNYTIMFFMDKNWYYSNMHGGGYQLYGTWHDRDTKAIYPIWDIENVDKRRYEIGAEPLWQFARDNNYILPESYTYRE